MSTKNTCASFITPNHTHTKYSGKWVQQKPPKTSEIFPVKMSHQISTFGVLLIWWGSILFAFSLFFFCCFFCDQGKQKSMQEVVTTVSFFLHLCLMTLCMFVCLHYDTAPWTQKHMTNIFFVILLLGRLERLLGMFIHFNVGKIKRVELVSPKFPGAVSKRCNRSLPTASQKHPLSYPIDLYYYDNRDSLTQ